VDGNVEDAVSESIVALVAAHGAHARPVREVLAALTDRSWTLAGLIQATAVPRRTVEEVLAALGDDLSGPDRAGTDPDRAGPGPAAAAHGLTITPDRREAYRRRFGYEQLRRTDRPDPLAARLAAATDLRTELADLVAAAPGARRALDHVAATPETAAWRGLWLDAQYDLAGARLLCVGDHDLTSLAAALVNPELVVTVVDLDERILDFIDVQARRLGLDVQCRYADLRLGLPAGAVASADLIFTDPPYTPEGVRLFLARGAEGLRDRERGRLVMAYGFSDRTPALGLKVQQAVQELALAYEAILPAVHRYEGAQAVGSASDLYICRPTARTWKALDRVVENAVNIYTHGPQSLERAAPALDESVVGAVLDAVGPTLTALVGTAWPPGTAEAGAAGGGVQVGGAHAAGAQVGGAQTDEVQVGAARTGGVPARVRLETLLAGGLPPVATVRGVTAVAVDLSADPGPWLLRALLAANADRLALLVPNGHPDVASEAGQRGLAELLDGKYRLRFRRSTPGPEHAVVVAEVVAPAGLDPARRLVRGVLDRAHGRIGNVWREGLIAAARRAGAPLTKNDARRAVRAAASRPDVLDAAAIELPRRQLAELLADVARSTL